MDASNHLATTCTKYIPLVANSQKLKERRQRIHTTVNHGVCSKCYKSRAILLNMNNIVNVFLQLSSMNLSMFLSMFRCFSVVGYCYD